MTDLIVFPNAAAASIKWLNTVTEVTAIVSDKISTTLPAEEDWPAIRLDPTGGGSPIPWRVDQPRFQVQCFALSDVLAMTLARVTRAAFDAMAGYRDPGVIVVIDVVTTSPQFIETQSFNAARNRVPLLSHATFSATCSVRPDP